MNRDPNWSRRAFLVRAGAATGALAVLGAGACSEHVDGPTGPDDGDVVEITIENFRFASAELRVPAGTTVRWRNTTSTFHTVTPNGHTAWTEWQTAGSGETFEVRFDQPGSYPYYCVPHRSLGMTGTVIVE